MENQEKTRKELFLQQKYGSTPEEENAKNKKEWDDLKKTQLIFAEFCNQHFDKIKLTENGLSEVNSCGDRLVFLADETLKHRKLEFGIFCKKRMCPTCAKRKSLRLILALSLFVEYINRNHPTYEYIFLTLTAPNVPGEALRDELLRYSRSFDNMIRRKKYKKVIKGFVRKLEITYNQERNDYHPHYHVIIAVNKRYFKSEDYINHSEWLADWQQAMNDTSITSVNIKKVYDKKVGSTSEMGRTTVSSGILELSKYVGKSSDYLKNDDVFLTFWNALYRMRDMTFGGVFKTAQNLFEAGLLDDLLKELRENEPTWLWRIYSTWCGEEYHETISPINAECDFSDLVEAFEEGEFGRDIFS